MRGPQQLLRRRTAVRNARRERRDQVAAGRQPVALGGDVAQRLAGLGGRALRLLEAPLGDLAATLRLGAGLREPLALTRRGQRPPAVVLDLREQLTAPRDGGLALPPARHAPRGLLLAAALDVGQLCLDARALRLGLRQLAQHRAHGLVGGAQPLPRALQRRLPLRDTRLERDRRVLVRRRGVGRRLQLRDAARQLTTAQLQQLATLLAERELLAERKRLLGALALAALRAIELGARLGDGALGGGDLRGEGLGPAPRRGERLRALVVARLRGGVRVTGAPQLELVVGLERGREPALERAVARGALGLALELAQPRRELADKHAHVAEVVARLREPPLGAGQLDAVAVDVGRLLDQVAALDRPEAQHLVDQPLRHHRVRVLPHLGAAEQVLHVEQPHLLAVDAVLALAGAVRAARDADLVEVDRHPVLGVVEDQRHLGHAERLAAVGAREDEVLAAARADRPRRLLPERPADGVGDVRLARAIGPDDRGQARPELEDLAIGERLKAIRLDPAQIHALPRLLYPATRCCWFPARDPIEARTEASHCLARRHLLRLLLAAAAAPPEHLVARSAPRR